MRIQRVILEYHGDIPFAGRKAVYYPITNFDGPVRYTFQPCNHTQQCRLATTRWAYEHNKLTVLNVHVDAMDHPGAAVTFFQVL